MKAKKIIFPLFAAAVLLPVFSSGAALLCGIAFALVFGNPYLSMTKKMTPRLLTMSVMGLGAGMNLEVIGRVGAHGIGYTMVGIAFTFLLGTFLGRVLETPSDSSILITVGTAICGGSAIAAFAPVIGAQAVEVSVALGIVFCLNAVALLIFPLLGHHFLLSQTQFGLWSALAIHDTSSVVGSTLQYGAQALEVGTTVKLARAMWIIPLTLAIGYWRAKRKPPTDLDSPAVAPKRPWFILGFLIAAALVTWVPALQGPGHVVEMVARRSLVLTLFLIGANLTLSTLRSVGIRPFLQGLILWITVGGGTLAAILAGWIS